MRVTRENYWLLCAAGTSQTPVLQSQPGCIFVVHDIPFANSGPVYISVDTRELASQEFVTDAVRAGVSGIILAGVHSGADIQLVDVMLSVAEATAGFSEGTLKILAIPGDNPAGLLDAASMSGKSRRLCALGWHRQDLAEACGHPAAADNLTGFERLARSTILLAAAACGVAAIDTPDDERDPERFLRLCQDARAEGFSGKIALHQEQLPIIRQVFGE